MVKVNAAIHYNPENYDLTGRKLMGKDSANVAFLKAFAMYAEVEDYYNFSFSKRSFDSFAQRIWEFTSPQKPVCRWVKPHRFDSLAEAGCLHLPAPQLGRYAWMRRAAPSMRNHSICGLTHTISSEHVMSYIGDFITAPTQAWDALICTSNVVKSSVEYVAGNWSEYLSARVGAAKPLELPIQLKVIPLGMHCDQFADTKEHREAGEKWRTQLGIGKDDVVVLFVGRLSFHAKTNPTPMYKALEKAAQQTDKKIHLIQAGWADNDALLKVFTNAPKEMCPSVTSHILDGRKEEVRTQIWFAADIFTSLSDNIQETFGLTPLEAMAAGLPVVVTDWNGYRDTVRDGIDGFTVPTLTPSPGMTYDLGFRFEMEVDNYDHYIGNASLVTSVDIAACAKAYAALIEDKALRRKMGDAGRKRAGDVYDWKHIIGRYQDLWGELAEIREGKTGEIAPRGKGKPSHPLYDDPFAVFSTYPTAMLRPEDEMCLLPGVDMEMFRRTRNGTMNSYGHLAPEEYCEKIITLLQEKGPQTVGALLEHIPEVQRPFMGRTLVWFAKNGLASIGEHNKAVEDNSVKKKVG